MGYECFPLVRVMLTKAHAFVEINPEFNELLTFSSKSWMVSSVCFSSSVGFEGIVAWENWEYL